MSDVVYIEELTHVMQIASDYSSVTAKLNLEVEAKVVWLYFAKTHNMRTLGFKEVFGGDANYRAFIDLTRYISDMMHGYDSGYNRETVDMLYDICAGGLRNNVQYADEKRYPYDESRKNYEIIRQLIEGC